MSNALGKFFGTPVAPAEAEGSLNGHPGSPGKMQGTARVVRSLAEAAKLGEGDVLVTGTTSPPWTPLFATAGAIVTDTGGILSHRGLRGRSGVYQLAGHRLFDRHGVAAAGRRQDR